MTVLSAKGLAKADVFGKSDPFAIVLLNRREVGRTRTLFKTLDPRWTEPRETFPLRIVGNKDRCSVAVQLWDEDLGEKEGTSAVFLYCFLFGSRCHIAQDFHVCYKNERLCTLQATKKAYAG